MVIPVFFVAKEQLPTPAALSELACASPNPTGGIFTRFDLRLIQQPKAKQDRSPVSSTRPCPKARDVRIAQFTIEAILPRHNHWIERQDCSDV
jgi:hypothetical protein